MYNIRFNSVNSRVDTNYQLIQNSVELTLKLPHAPTSEVIQYIWMTSVAIAIKLPDSLREVSKYCV